MKSDFMVAVTQLAAERNLSKETVIAAIEAALVSAYKKDSVAAGQNIKVKLDPVSGEVNVYLVKTVVESPTDLDKEISLAEAMGFKKDAQVGEEIPVSTIVQSAGRIAAQTAKQVVIQRLREAERELIYQEYAGREGDIVTGTVQRIEPRQIIVDLGRAEAILPYQEQVPTERYRSGQKMKVYVVEVRRTSKGPEIIISRSHKDLVKRLFEMEVPEIYSGAVEIKAIAREAGSRGKVAVWARREGVDPVGSCVGLRGIRIQNIVNELQGEKVDVVEWNKDQAIFLANALNPSQVTRVELNREGNSATVVVPDRHLSLAIGKEGQNVRLAAKLTGWKIDIKSVAQAEEERLRRAAESKEASVQAAAAIETTGAVEAAEQVIKEAARAPGRKKTKVAPLAVEPGPAPEAGVMEEGEKKEVATEKKEKVAALSPEEELAALSLAESIKAEEGEGAVPQVAKALSLDEVPEEVWTVPLPQTREPSRLRFAEEIVGTRANKAMERKSNKVDKPDSEGQKAKRTGKRGRSSGYKEEDPDE